jgi:hypothetical protein
MGLLRHPLTWFGLGALSVWGYHRWINPMKTTKAA